MPRMSAEQIQEFLSQPGQLMRLGTIDADGMPRVVPTWFLHEDGKLWFTPRARSAFMANLRRDRRVGISIDEESHPYRKLTIQGVAELVYDVGADDDWRDMYRRIVARYITPAEAGEAYVQDTIDQPRALFSLDLSRAKMTSWRNPLDGEDLSSMWARRYYKDGSKLALAAADRSGGTSGIGWSRSGWYQPDPTPSNNQQNRESAL